MSDTLLLNADGLPLRVVPLSALGWRQSIKQMFLDTSEVLSFYDDWEVHSPTTTVKVPAVMLLRDYVKQNKAVKFSKDNIFLRDGHKCQYCGVTSAVLNEPLTLDHVIPRFLGGKTTWENVVAACSKCNHEKAHYLTMKPMCGMPRKPSYYELVNQAQQQSIEIPHESWLQFTGWDPAKVTIKTRQRPKP